MRGSGLWLVNMYLLYSLLLTLSLLALLPYFIYQALRHGKYAGNFKERMGWLPRSARATNQPTVWVHAVSVGEFNASRPLIAALKQKLPGHRIVVSTTTVTGQRLAREQVPLAFDATFYFPFDWAFAARRALRSVSPRMVIILETELWPNFLRECRRRNVMVVIANGRISERSFARYLRVRPFIARLMNDVSLLVMQSKADAERASALGASERSVRVCGNLKYDVSGQGGLANGEASDRLINQEALDYNLALSSTANLIVAGSTAPGEEKMLLDALAEIRKQARLEGARLIIAPRHPERFDEVASSIARSGFKFARRSQAVAFSAGPDSKIALGFVREPEPGVTADARQADVILLDSIGELAYLYRYAAVVFVGGSLVARGGHNVIEPAVYAKPIIVGPHTQNFRRIIDDFARAEALVQVSDAGDFVRELIKLLTDRASARAMGERAKEILLKNQGATECTVAAILQMPLKPSSR